MGGKLSAENTDVGAEFMINFTILKKSNTMEGRLLMTGIIPHKLKRFPLWPAEAPFLYLFVFMR